VVFGSLEAVNHVLAPLGWHINTAFVERLNLSIRQHVAAVGRRVSTLCKGEDGLRQQVALYHVYYNPPTTFAIDTLPFSCSLLLSTHTSTRRAQMFPACRTADETCASPQCARTRSDSDAFLDERRAFHTACRACCARPAPRDQCCN